MAQGGGEWECEGKGIRGRMGDMEVISEWNDGESG